MFTLSEIVIKDIIDVLVQAHREILKIYNDYEKNNLTVYTKDDKSPLTMADLASNKIICDYLENGRIPIISEESKTVEYETRKEWNIFWLVDPLDGTKEFIKRNGQFTTNIALVEEGEPIFGFVGIPVEGKIYYGGKGYGIFCYDHIKDETSELVKRWEKKDKNTVRVIVSNSHLNKETEDYIKEVESSGKTVEQVRCGSSLKFIKIIEEEADIYPRLAPTMEWDTAASHALITEYGASVNDVVTGKEMIYNKNSLKNNSFVVM